MTIRVVLGIQGMALLRSSPRTDFRLLDDNSAITSSDQVAEDGIIVGDVSSWRSSTARVSICLKSALLSPGLGSMCSAEARGNCGEVDMLVSAGASGKTGPSPENSSLERRRNETTPEGSEDRTNLHHGFLLALSARNRL